MNGRESRESNDIFFVCSFIEFVSRKMKNTRKVTLNAIGRENIEKLYEYADVYHCQSMEETMCEILEKCEIKQGNFDNVKDCEYSVPDYWDIGRVYNNLIMDIKNNKQEDNLINILFDVYNSWITEYIDDYNSNMYYSNPDYIYQCYIEGELIKE